MKKLFYLGLAGLVLFEVVNVYFIMPMPGSQRMNSLDLAYFLHAYRWYFRIAALLAIGVGCRSAWQTDRRWRPILAGALTLGVVWFFNFQMAADAMFKQPSAVVLKSRAENQVDESSVVIGVEHNGEARAYPVRFLVYHHQVQDVVGGKPVIVTYCSVCRTGRIFEPVVKGQPEKFRLVGMDHFNAMFEDVTTHSWWRQATGEAVAGPLKGGKLPETLSGQLTLHRWFELHPAGLVMQPDGRSTENYDIEGKFERGKSKGDLTRTDPASWQDKSWVVGVDRDGVSKAYDWNRLKQTRVINDRIGAKPIVIVLGIDRKTFAVFERPATAPDFTMDADRLTAAGKSYDLSGRELKEAGEQLVPVQAYQEFWHSWRTFHPATQKYE